MLIIIQIEIGGEIVIKKKNLESKNQSNIFFIHLLIAPSEAFSPIKPFNSLVRACAATKSVFLTSTFEEERKRSESILVSVFTAQSKLVCFSNKPIEVALLTIKSGSIAFSIPSTPEDSTSYAIVWSVINICFSTISFGALIIFVPVWKYSKTPASVIAVTIDPMSATAEDISAGTV